MSAWYPRPSDDARYIGEHLNRLIAAIQLLQDTIIYASGESRATYIREKLAENEDALANLSMPGTLGE